METTPYQYLPTQHIDTSSIDWSSVNMIQPAYAQPLTEVAKEPGMWSNILSWLNASPLNWGMVIFAIIVAAQIYVNGRNKSASIRPMTAFSMFVMSIWGVWLNFNAWLGGTLALLSLWLLAQATSYKDEMNEEDEEVEEEPIKQPTIPAKIPVRPLPQPHAFDGFNMPSVGINDWFGRCL